MIFDCIFTPVIQGHINIYGDIYSDQSSTASEWGIVSLKTVKDQISANESATELIVHIHSRGGDVNEGFAIYDALIASGKKITTVIEGMCASIATIIALAGTTRKITENSEFMIHNPWGMIAGTAEEIQKYADQVQAYEDKILNFYIEKTGGNKKQIAAMMQDETTLGAATALEMKFVTEIVETVQAFALLKSKKFKPMSKEKSVLQKAIDGFIAVVKNLAPTALTLSTTDGKTLEIDQEGDVLIMNSPVNIDGKPADDGDYALSTGSTITVAAGKISAIKLTEEPAAAAPAPAPTPDPKDAQITALTTENQRLKDEQAASATALQNATAILARLKGITSKEKPAERTKAATSSTEDEVEETRAQAAVRRAKEARAAAQKKVTA